MMPRQVWLIAGLLTTALVIGLLGLSTWVKSSQVDQLKAELVDARATALKSQFEAKELKARLAQNQATIDALQKEKEAAAQTHQTLEQEMRAALESKDVTISQLQGKLTVSILDRVLFDSGEAELKPEGSAVLTKVAAILAQHPKIKIHVIGHTDNVPIKASARNRFPSNWELSTARATAAVRFLTEHAGVDPRRLGVVGYGEFRPIAANSTAEGRAKNRRIAITILSEELAGSDVVPAPATNPEAQAVAPAAEPQSPDPAARPAP